MCISYFHIHRKKPAILSELSRLESAKEAHKQTLPSFLILPNQRVMRMPMLLEAVLSQLNSVHCVRHVQDCLFEVQKVTDNYHIHTLWWKGDWDQILYIPEL